MAHQFVPPLVNQAQSPSYTACAPIAMPSTPPTTTSKLRSKEPVKDTSAVMWSTDCDLRLVDFCGAAPAELAPHIPEQPTGMAIAEFFQIESPDAPLIAAHRRALEGESVSVDFEWASHGFRGYVGPQRNSQMQIVGCHGFAQEITERIEGDPGEIEQRFRTLVRLSPAGVYLTDAEGNCTYVNERWCDMAGMKPAEALGQGWVGAIHPEDRERVKQRWYAVAGSEDEWSLEYRMQTPRGNTTWVFGQAKPLHDSEGKIIGYMGINLDITDRKNAERIVRESEQRYADLLSAVTSYTYSVEIEDNIPVSTKHGPGCAATTGYTAEDYAANPSLWIDMVHQDDRDEVRQHAAKVLQGEAVPPIEHRIRHKDGTVLWMRDTIVCHRDEAGALVRYDGLVEDITDRKRGEVRLRRVLESAPDAMVLVDQDGLIVLANAQTEATFGYGREELLQRPIEVLLPERFHRSHSLQRAEYSTAPRPVVLSERPGLVGRRKDGSEFPAEIGLSPIETGEGVLILAAVRDITQRQKMERELQSNLHIQSALNLLLGLSLQSLSLEEYLGRSLDLLFTIPWIELESKGAVFLVEDDPQSLVMKTQRGLSDGHVNACQNVAFGHCICGRAAATRQIAFKPCINEHHETTYGDMLPHGHYCVPIISDDELLGVFNLYVKHGHEKSPQEEEFLSAVANVLAGTIKRQRAEESLRESEERFDLAVRGTDAGIWDWNLLTNEVFYSAQWKKMLGYDEEEVPNDFSEWERRLHPDDRERAMKTVQGYLEEKTPDYELEHRLRHKDGSYRWILARGAVVRDEQGKPYRMVGSQLDITERKRSEQVGREREGQLVAAQKIQEHILPRGAPVVPGFDIAAGLTAAEFAAGDYFDYLCLPDGSLGIVVGDVSGHGFGAALLMASTAAHLRSFAEEHSDLEEIVKHTNALLLRAVEEDRFVTLLFARIGLSSRTLRYVNAGHPSGYVLRQSGEVKAVLESSTLPLAILPEGDFRTSDPIALEPDDVIVLVTDGVLEAFSPDDRLFGKERMLEAVRANRHRKAEKIIESLQKAIREFTGGGKLQDDVTVVVMKVKTSAESGQA